MALRVFLVSIAALMAGSAIEYARADEAYLCDGNVVVMVASGTLERMKRENACVASHYGLEAVGAPEIPLPVPHPARAHTASAGTATVVASGLRGVQGFETEANRTRQFAGSQVRVINRAMPAH